MCTAHLLGGASLLTLDRLVHECCFVDGSGASSVSIISSESLRTHPVVVSVVHCAAHFC